MDNTELESLEALKPLAKPGTKFTIIALGGGLMGCDVKMNATSKGWINSQRGRTLAWAKPRARKMSCLIHVLRHGAILLEGHRADEYPIFEGDVYEGGVRSMILDGKGGRFVDDKGDKGDSLIAYLKKHLICHTLALKGRLILLTRDKVLDGRERDAVDPYFNVRLIEELGPSLDLEPPAPEKPKRKQLLTDVMKERLKACQDIDPPKILYKIFNPEGSQTWLLCSLEEDGDTLWAVCDIGMGCVEYGTVSLEELETTVGKQFKMPLERDIHFDGKDLDFNGLLDLEHLQGTLPRHVPVP